MNESLILSELKALKQLQLLTSKEVLTIEEASMFTGLAVGTLKEYVFKKKIGAYKPGIGHSAKLYFEKSELLSYMRRNRVHSNDELDLMAATHTFLNRKAS